MVRRPAGGAAGGLARCGEAGGRGDVPGGERVRRGGGPARRPGRRTAGGRGVRPVLGRGAARRALAAARGARAGGHRLDRKSTRLNSSHLVISYAVFCLKKKKQS